MTALDQPLAETRHDARDHCQRFLEATRAVTMKPLLLAALGGDQAETCHVLDAKYEHGKRSVVLYQLGDRLVRATVGPKARPGDGLEVLGGVRVTCFPHDPALPTLASVADADALAGALDAALPGASVTHVRSRLLRYRPGRRATFLLTVGLRTAGETSTTRMVAKVYHDPAKAAAVAAEGVALQRDVVPAPLALAPIVAHLPDLATVVQGHLYGRDLNVGDAGRGVASAPNVVNDIARSAQALAAFHRRTVPDGRIRSIDRELERFVTRANGVIAVDVDTGGDLLDLAHRLGALRRLRPGGPTSLVHGDCKPSQFLVQTDAVALLDLDHCGIADPAYDVGNFVASLRQQAVQSSPGSVRARQWAAEMAGVFADTYLTATTSQRAADPDGFCSRIDFYAAVALTRKALRAFARAPRSPLPGLLVAEAHRGLDQPGGSRS
jgi:hypothetical protein